MRQITFTLPEDIIAPDAIARTIKGICDGEDFLTCMSNINTQLDYMKRSPAPRGGDVSVGGGCDTHGNCHVEGSVSVHF